MHRVELKGFMSLMSLFCGVVPNAPCGVERQVIFEALVQAQPFLMHRVELKAGRFTNSSIISPFLMHRVESKGRQTSPLRFIACPVPNAPCGVERTLS